MGAQLERRRSYGDGDVVIGEDKSCVHAGEFVILSDHFSLVRFERIVVLVVDIISILDLSSVNENLALYINFACLSLVVYICMGGC